MTLKGERQLRARLTAIGQTDQLTRDISIGGVREAKLIVHRRTGNLGRTIRVGSPSRDRAEIKAGGTSQVGYAGAEEMGARPHIIRPRKAKVLAWGGARTLGGRSRSGSGPTRFARMVRHPGQKPHPYLRPGLLQSALNQGVEAIVRLWNGAA